jgi:hypothetical protein
MAMDNQGDNPSFVSVAHYKNNKNEATLMQFLASKFNAIEKSPNIPRHF